MSSDDLKWDIFVSHNSKQRPWVDAAAHQWRRHGLKVCVDEDDFQFGSFILAEIERAIRNSRVVVLVLTNDALRSDWVAVETAMALHQNTTRSKKLICIKLETIDESLMPAVLAAQVSVDLSVLDQAQRRKRYHRFLRQINLRADPLPDIPDPKPLFVGDDDGPVVGAIPTSVDTPRDFDLVIGIDFGSSSSGYAYVQTNLPEDIYVRLRWHAHPNKSYPKTLTALLYNPHKQVHSFGHSAPHALAGLQKSGVDGGYRLVQNLKLPLKTAVMTYQGPVWQAPEGDSFPLLPLVADYLKELTTFALQQLALKRGGPVDLDRVRWCLSVPALWGDTEKQCMRSAAILGKLISDAPSDASRLLMVLEPEAAALYCISFLRRNDKWRQLPSVIMVIDAGAGTVDLTVHCLNPDGALYEVIPGEAALCGGLFVDAEFIRYVERQFGLGVLTDLKCRNFMDYLELMDSWEQQKCDPPVDEFIFVKLPYGLHTLLSSGRYSQRLAAFKKRHGGDVSCLKIPKEHFLRFFEPSINTTIGLITRAFERLQVQGVRCNYVFLVGGFAESLLLASRVREVIETECAHTAPAPMLVIPDDPAQAVVWGCARYGIEPSAIRVRLARRTYGYKVVRPFREGIDDERKRVTNPKTGKQECRECFQVLVRSGERIPFGRRIQVELMPLRDSQQRASFRFYVTKLADPIYVDDEGVSPLKSLILQLPPTTGSAPRILQLSISFGTEVDVRAVDTISGKDADAKWMIDETFYPEEVDPTNPEKILTIKTD